MFRHVLLFVALLVRMEKIYSFFAEELKKRYRTGLKENTFAFLRERMEIL